MRRFLLASHAYLAEGLLSSLNLVMGKQEAVDIMCAYTDEDYDIKQNIGKCLGRLSEQDELIIVTDVLGGSVNNEFMSVIKHTDKKIYLIAGLNLPLVMSLLIKKDSGEPTERIIHESIREAKESICFCNDL